MYIQCRELRSAPLPISDFERWGGSSEPKLTLSSSLQATCPPQPSSLDSLLLCHPCRSFLCPHRQSWYPSGLALAWLPTSRPGMREAVQSGKEMGWEGSDTACPSTAPSSFLCLLPICGPCPSYMSPDCRSRAHPLLTLALRRFQLAVIKTSFKLAVVQLSIMFFS